MARYSLAEAIENLAQLFDQAVAGEKIIIAVAGGKVQLMPVAVPPPPGPDANQGAERRC